ncbi:MAG: hypothetical protein WKF70_06435 [Chitinophagaceae bacterium]
MPRIYFKSVLLACLYLANTKATAQTEFPKEFIAHVRLHSGLATAPAAGPDLFVGGLQLVAQVTILPYQIRGGLAGGGFYTNNRIDGSLGPTVSLKIKEFKGGHFGSLGNLHLNLDHFWGTGSQRLAGGGLNLDLLNKLVVSITAHRDYRLTQWWVQSGIAFRISKVKQPKETFPN